MSSQPLVSVAMPVYNAEKYLKEAIDSILNQRYTNIEFLMVNDSSTDSSKEIILGYNDPRIRYIENEKNLGIVKTRNKCIEYAAGDYIAILDNDDISDPTRIQKQVEFMEANKDFGLSGSFYEVIDGNGKKVAKMELPSSDKEVKTYLLFDNCFCNSSVMMRSSLIKGNPYPEGLDMVEDYYFLINLARKSRLTNLPFYSTQYRIHGTNTSIKKLDGLRAKRKEIDAQTLRDIKIDFTEEELALHTNFFTRNFHYFQTGAQYAALEKWLIKLYDHLVAGKEYDAAVIRQVFVRRWVLTILITKKNMSKLFFNKLAGKFFFSYVGIFAGVIKEKYSKTKSFT